MTSADLVKVARFGKPRVVCEDESEGLAHQARCRPLPEKSLEAKRWFPMPPAPKPNSKRAELQAIFAEHEVKRESDRIRNVANDIEWDQSSSST
jgi:hypothetical protein